MHASTALPPFENVRQWSPDHVWTLVYDVWDGVGETRVQLQEGNWWLGLAQMLAEKAFAADEPEQIQWAQLVTAIYERLTRRSQDDSIEVSHMLFTARFLVSHGLQREQGVGSIGEIVGWFLERLPMSFEEVQRLLPITTQKLTEMPLTSIRQLRGIKNRLLVLEYIQKHYDLPHSDSVEKWISIRGSLP